MPAHTYQCNGVNDNVIISQMIQDFFNTDDGAQILKIEMTGTAGYDLFHFGDGSYDDPYILFSNPDSANPYNKKVILDGANCIFPLIDYTFDTPQNESSRNVRLFEMCNVSFFNLMINVKGHLTSAANTELNFYGFHKCNGMFDCGITATILSSSGNSWTSYYAFTQCQNLRNCNSMLLENAFSGNNNINYFAFNNCHFLSGCKAGLNAGNTSGVQFYNYCGNLTACGIDITTAKIEDIIPFNYCWYIDNIKILLSNTNIYYTRMFVNCGELSNIEVEVTIAGDWDWIFWQCEYLVNCQIKVQTSANQPFYTRGFYLCSKLSNCSYDNAKAGLESIAFLSCKLLTNCVIKMQVRDNSLPVGFYSCEGLSNCESNIQSLANLALDSSLPWKFAAYYACKSLTGYKGSAYRYTASASTPTYVFYTPNDPSEYVNMTNCEVISQPLYMCKINVKYT